MEIIKAIQVIQKYCKEHYEYPNCSSCEIRHKIGCVPYACETECLPHEWTVDE